jgi:hypothetical protein
MLNQNPLAYGEGGRVGGKFAYAIAAVKRALVKEDYLRELGEYMDVLYKTIYFCYFLGFSKET